MRNAIMDPKTMVTTMLVAGLLSSSAIGIGRMMLNAEAPEQGQQVVLLEIPAEQITISEHMR